MRTCHSAASAQCSTSIFDGSVSFDVCPPVNDPLPVALHRNCAVLSLYTLKLVNQQWESYQLNGKGWQWSHAEDGVRDVYVMATAFVQWMASTRDLDYVGKISAKYPICYKQSFLLSRSPTVLQKRSCEVVNDANFVIRMKLMKRVNSALITWMRQQTEVEDLDPSQDDVVSAAFLASEMAASPLKCARHLLAFFAFNRIIDDYRMDLLWLEQDWSGVSPMKHVFLERTPAEAGTVAAEVAQLFRQSSLSRTVVMPSGPTGRSITSTLRDLVGKVARNRRLNDAAMDAGLWHVSKYSTNRYAVDAVSVSNEEKYPLASCNFALVPIHMKALEHWMVQIIEIQMRDADTRKHKIWPTLYDPLGVSSNFDVCQAKWISFTIPVV
ncbi:hypothetical protein JG687_00013927 [Phytophthora cactorum]|uniref:Uncharacterized protein n=1 Tax=Phytophthora cactorum TaxID=29920 RepID=A0A8T1U0M0_9STRA|nr:hypothetical protein JG687_00013927 [Phytophthora cactorum]